MNHSNRLNQSILNNRPSHRQTGLTMVESMIALLIIAGALTMLVLTTQMSWRTESTLRDQTFAHWVAMNQVTVLQLQAIAPSLGTQKSTSEMLNVDWEVVTVTNETENDLIRRLEVQVFQRNIDPEDPLSIVTLFLPTIDPANIPAANLLGGNTEDTAEGSSP